MTSFDQALNLLLEHEGSEYTDHPNDHGGPTKYGIALNMDRGYLSELFGRAPTAKDIQNLTVAQAAWVYRKHYWEPMRLDQVVVDVLAALLFDQCVLLGLSGCTKTIQGCLGLPQDGKMGPKTLQAINKANPDQLMFDFLMAVQDRHIKRVQSDPSQIVFLPGWLRRSRDLLAFLLGLKYDF